MATPRLDELGLSRWDVTVLLATVVLAILMPIVGQQTEMLEDLPKPLHIEIALHLNRNILTKVPLFSGASQGFFRELVLHLKPMVFLPGQMLMRRGEVGDELFFINKGSVEVLSRDDSEVLAVLSDGDFVGEMACSAASLGPTPSQRRRLELLEVVDADRAGVTVLGEMDLDEVCCGDEIGELPRRSGTVHQGRLEPRIWSLPTLDEVAVDDLLGDPGDRVRRQRPPDVTALVAELEPTGLMSRSGPTPSLRRSQLSRRCADQRRPAAPSKRARVASASAGSSRWIAKPECVVT